MSKSTIDRLADALTCLLNDWQAYRDIPRRTSDGLQDQAEKALEAYRRERGEGPEAGKSLLFTLYEEVCSYLRVGQATDQAEVACRNAIRDVELELAALRDAATRDHAAAEKAQAKIAVMERGLASQLKIDPAVVDLGEEPLNALLWHVAQVVVERDRLAARVQKLETATVGYSTERAELRAQVERLEVERDHYRVAVSKLQERLSRLDAMLSREAVPNGLWSAVAQWPCLDHGRIVTGAWNWFREMFGPAQASEDVQGEPEGRT